MVLYPKKLNRIFYSLFALFFIFLASEMAIRLLIKGEVYAQMDSGFKVFVQLFSLVATVGLIWWFIKINTSRIVFISNTLIIPGLYPQRSIQVDLTNVRDFNIKSSYYFGGGSSESTFFEEKKLILKNANDEIIEEIDLMLYDSKEVYEFIKKVLSR